jgi:hypothetical protein
MTVVRAHPQNYVLKISICRDRGIAVHSVTGMIPGSSARFIALCVGLVILCARLVHSATPAEAPTRCEICGGPFVDSIYVVDDPIRQVKKHICLACSKSKVICSACGLAANPKTLRKLGDGRILCELDVKGAVLSEVEGRDIFQEVKRDVQRMLAHWGPLPDTNITAYLVDHNDFTKEFRRKPSVDDPDRLLGLTRSDSDDGTNYDHRIYLLSGVLKAQFMATCAHEYTHTWLNEHSEKTRTLHKDTVEGFCELMAWKYVAAKNDRAELNRILDNPYTRGQVDALIAAEQRYQFYRVIDWIHRGVDSWLDVDKLDRLLALKEVTSEEPPAILWPQQAVPTRVPDKLVLRGISGTAARRLAFVNDRTLEKNEQARVRVGGSNVTVRCLEIRERSVLLRLDGRSEPFELFLPRANGKD